MIVVASGADEENETEFAEALCTATGPSAAELDTNKHGTVSVRELAKSTRRRLTGRWRRKRRYRFGEGPEGV